MEEAEKLILEWVLELCGDQPHARARISSIISSAFGNRPAWLLE